MKGGADDGLGEGWAITIAAEVAEVEVTQLGGHDFRGELSGGVVGQVAVAAKNALLGGPGALGVVLEHFDVVIRFEDEDVGLADAFDDEPGGVTEIGKETDIAGVGAEEESNGIVSVVRDAEGIDGDVTEFEGGAGGEEPELKRHLELRLDGFLGQAVAVDGNVQFAGKDAETLGVVRVLVGDENSAQVLGGPPDTEESLADLPGTEAGIDEQAGVFGLKIGTVATGAAGENGEARRHGATLKTVRCQRKLKSSETADEV